MGWTFSIGVSRGYVILPWWTLAAFAVLGAITPWWLIEMEGFGGGDGDNEDEENGNESQSESEETSSAIPASNNGLSERKESSNNHLGSKLSQATQAEGPLSLP